MADRIGLLNKGRLVQVGTPRALFENPTNCFVAGFLGDVVLLEGVVRESGLSTSVDLAVGSVCAPASAHARGTRLFVALRPERIRIEPGEGPNRLTGVVDAIIYAGATVEIGVCLPDGARLRLVRPAEAPSFVPGTSITVAWDVDAVMLLGS